MPNWNDPRFAPPDGAAFDFGHPLAQGMICCLVPNGAGQVVDLIRDRISGAGTTDFGAYGPRMRDWSIANAQIPDLMFTSGGWTVGAFFDLEATVPASAFPRIFGQGTYASETSNAGWALGIYPPGNSPAGYSFEVRHNSSTATSVVTWNTTAAVGDHSIVGTYAPGTSTASIYVDGVSRNSFGSVSSPLASAGNLGNATATAAVPAYIAYAWMRTLSAPEVGLLNREPFAMFRPPPIRAVYFSATPSASASMAATLAGSTFAGSGAFAAPGSMAATLAGASLAASGTLTTSAAMAATLAGDALAASGSLVVSAAMGVVLADDALAGSAAQAASAAMGVVLAGDALAASGSLASSAAMGVTLADDAFAGAGTLVINAVGSMAATLADDTFQGRATGVALTCDNILPWICFVAPGRTDPGC